jgi:hypothetical protein
MHRTSRYLNRLANGAVERKRPEEFTAKQVRQWILRRPDRLDADDRDRLQSICARSPIIAATTELAQGSTEMFTCSCGERARTDDQRLSVYVEMDQAPDGPRMYRVGLAHVRCQASRVVWRPGPVEQLLAAAAREQGDGERAFLLPRIGPFPGPLKGPIPDTRPITPTPDIPALPSSSS